MTTRFAVGQRVRWWYPGGRGEGTVIGIATTTDTPDGSQRLVYTVQKDGRDEVLRCTAANLTRMEEV